MERESSREKLERKSKRGLLQQTAPLRLIKDSTDKTAPQLMGSILQWLYLQPTPPQQLSSQLPPPAYKTITYLDIQVQQCQFSFIRHKPQFRFLQYLHSLPIVLCKSTKADSQLWGSMLSRPPNSTASKSYQQIVYEKYLRYTLTKKQLQENNYPGCDPKLQPVEPKWLVLPNMVTERPLHKKILSIDCQMVKTKSGGLQLARITIIDLTMQTLYDQLILPENPVVDYLTQFSGITKEMLDASTKTVKDLHEDLRGMMDSQSVLVGHSLEADLRAMGVKHERVIDTAVMYSGREGRKVKLKHLVQEHLKYKIQNGPHDSAEDARSALSLAKLEIEIMNPLISTSYNYEILKELAERCSVQLVCNQYGRYVEGVEHIKENILVQTKKCTDTFRECKEYLVASSPNTKLLFVGLVYNQEKNWLNYYTKIQAGLASLYESAPSPSLFHIHFRINYKTTQLIPGFKYQKLYPYSILYSKT